MLHVLNSAGLLLPPGPKERYPPFATDIHSVVFPDKDMSDRCETNEPSMTPIADLGGLRDLLGGQSSPQEVAEVPVAKVGQAGDAVEEPAKADAVKSRSSIEQRGNGS